MAKKEKEKDKKGKKQKKQSFNYFDVFIRMADLSCASAAILEGVMHNFDPAALPAKLEELHRIEHTEDTEKHDMMKALAREFITPIEREDIALLAQRLDDVTDAIEDVLVKIYTFNITELRPEAVQFSEIIVQCCQALKTAMTQFKNFKKNGEALNGAIIEINRLESEGDELYTSTMRHLHVHSSDPIEIMVWSKTFNYLEGCCDSFESVADAVENIVMKNS